MEEEFHREQQLTETTEKDSSLLQRTFKTDIYFIKEYCTSLCQFILEDDTLKSRFVGNLSRPLSWDFLELLQWYRTDEFEKPTGSYNSFKDTLLYPYFKAVKREKCEDVIDQNMFKMWNASCSVIPTITQDLKQHDQEATEETLALEQCFLQSILAALNESFDLERPCGQAGVAAPWAELQLRPNHFGVASV